MAAGVSQAGQRVVLGAQRDVEVAAADLRGERGVEFAIALGDVEPAFCERGSDSAGRTYLLPGDFRMVIQIA